MPAAAISTIAALTTEPPGRKHVYSLAVDGGLTRLIDKRVQRVCRALQKTTQSFERDLLAGSKGQRSTAPDRASRNTLQRCLRCRNPQRLGDGRREPAEHRGAPAHGFP